jgi:hypothetical protein
MPTVACQFLCLEEISYLELSTYYCKQVVMSKLYVFAYVTLYIYRSNRISIPVAISSFVSTTMPTFMSITLHRDYCCYLLCVICRQLYAKARIPVYIC